MAMSFIQMAEEAMAEVNGLSAEEAQNDLFWWPICLLTMKKLAVAVLASLLFCSHVVLAQSLTDCGGSIVFDSNRTGVSEIYVVNSDGSGERQLTFANVREDLSSVDFLRLDPREQLEFRERVDSSRFPDLSPDGSRVVFQGNRLGEGLGIGIYVMNCATREVRLLIADAEAHGPRWSPDGRQIAFTQSRGISIVEADGSNFRKIDGLPDPSSAPSWSPDGNQIAFVSRGAVAWEIFTVELGSGRIQQLTHTTEARTANQGPAWSPDGSKIAYDRVQDRNYDIYVMDADGSNIQRLTHNDKVDARPAWSPDGQRIAFHSRRDGSSDQGSLSESAIYVMDADGGNVERLTSNDQREAHPRWGR